MLNWFSEITSTSQRDFNIMIKNTIYQKFWRPSWIWEIYMGNKVKILPAMNSSPID